MTNAQKFRRLSRLIGPEAGWLRRHLSQIPVLALALVVVGLLGSDAQAGLMFSWDQNETVMHGNPAVDAAFNSTRTSLGSAAIPPPVHSGESSGDDRQSAQTPDLPLHVRIVGHSVIADLTSPASGASAPVNGSTGGGSPGSPAALCSLVVDSPMANEFHRWCEQSPRPPLLPALELLDPPKAFA